MMNEDAEHFWNAILEAGKEFGIIPCGLGARDTLRLEKGFCLYGHDINDETSQNLKKSLPTLPITRPLKKTNRQKNWLVLI